METEEPQFKEVFINSYRVPFDVSSPVKLSNVDFYLLGTSTTMWLDFKLIQSKCVLYFYKNKI